MTDTIDVDVLLYASHAGSPFQERATAFLEERLTSPEPLILLWPALMGYLRLVTNPRLLGAPLTPATAQQNISALLARPNVRVRSEDELFWANYLAIAEGQTVTGNLVPDAHLVALMRANGVDTIWTHDRDFRKFDGIKVRSPFDAS